MVPSFSLKSDLPSCNYRFWLVGCFGFNGPLRQYFSLYQAVSQREGERGERIDESKNVQTTPTRTYGKRKGPCPTVIQSVGRPGTGSLPSTIAPPDHPRAIKEISKAVNLDWINNQACRLSHNINVITNLFMTNNYHFEMIRKIIFTDYFSEFIHLVAIKFRI